MARRAMTTLLLVRSGMVARADFAARGMGILPMDSAGPTGLKPVPLFFQQRRLAGQISVDSSVREALELGGRCGRNVWVLCEEVWTQVLSLSAVAVGGLGHSELRRAIGFEVEALAGGEGDESAIGVVRLGDADGAAQFWVSQMPARTRRAIQDLVALKGGVLRGICHPGGLPSAMGGEGRDFRRVEIWNGASICIARETAAGASQVQEHGQDARATTSVRVIAGEAGHEKWLRDMLRWRETGNGAAGEWLDAREAKQRDVRLSGTESWATLSLEDEALGQWLGRWAGILENDSAAVPVVPPGEALVRARHYVFAAIALLVLATLACAFHWKLVHDQIGTANQTLAIANQPRQRIDEVKKEAEAAAKEQQTLLKANDALEASSKSSRVDASAYRGRVARALRELAACADSELVIDRLVAEPEGVLAVHGFALGAASADGLAMNLSRALAASGWEVSPAEKTAQRLQADGGPWAFQLRLRPPGASTASGTPAARSRGGNR
jgi:hypothetical protein